MSGKLIRGTGAEGWERFTWAQLCCVIADLINCRCVRDDGSGTGTEFRQTVFDAAAKYNRGGKVLCVDKDGRRITANHLRLGAASVRLKELLQAFGRNELSQSAIAAEMKKKFALDVTDVLRRELSLATKVKDKIRDLVNVASRVILQSIKRQDQEFKAADSRFIQATRGLYKRSLAHLADLEGSRHVSLERAGAWPKQSPEEQRAENQAWAIKIGFEQDFNWEKSSLPTTADALSRLGSFTHLFFHVGGEETMRGLLYDVKSCLNHLAKKGVSPPIKWSVIPDGQAEPTQSL